MSIQDKKKPDHLTMPVPEFWMEVSTKPQPLIFMQSRAGIYKTDFKLIFV